MSWKRFLFFGMGMIALAVVSGCASLGSLGSSSQVFPSSLGLDVNIEQLRVDARDYDVYYSGPQYNPSAILFVPEKKRLVLQLDKDWKNVAPGPDLDELFWKIEMGNPNQVKLKAVVPPREGERTAKDVLAYIYTEGYASLKVLGPQSYKLRDVPEQFNPIYHNQHSFL